MKVESMIQTSFYDGQGLGNQLWVYAAARGLAIYLGRQHHILGEDLFKGAGFIEIDFGYDPSPNLPITQFKETLFYDPELKFFSSGFDERVINLPPRVKIDGLFQSEAYLFGQISELSQWIRPTAKIIELARDYENTCVLNLRGGEYKRHKNLILPRKYWDQSLNIIRKELEIDQFLIVTDDPAYAHAFLPEFPVLEGGIEDCYAALMGAKALILSNSSFSYFPIKTRHDQPFVIGPEHWARYGHPKKRWAMPSNVYEGWNYLRSDGSLLSYDECHRSASIDADYYQREFNIRIPPSMDIGSGSKYFLPVPIKKLLKRFLGQIFPKSIG